MKCVKEHINEKFTEDSDPIRDMGIGREYLKTLWRKEYISIGGISSYKTYDRYFGSSEIRNDKSEEYKHDVIMHIYYTFEQAMHDNVKDDNEAFKLACKQYSFHRTSSENHKNIHKQAIIFLNKKFYMNIDINLYKSLNEKFTLDSDPIHDMGIGINVIRNFNSMTQIIDFLMEFLPYILNKKQIPKDIINDEKYLLKETYLNILNEYMRKYIRLNNEFVSYTLRYDIYNTIKKNFLTLGYKKPGYPRK